MYSHGLVRTTELVLYREERFHCIHLQTLVHTYMYNHCFNGANTLMRWCVCTKVGGNSAGKVSTVQCLAQLTGHKLVEFPMNSETDTTELLGGFEQVPIAVHIL